MKSLTVRTLGMTISASANCATASCSRLPMLVARPSR